MHSGRFIKMVNRLKNPPLTNEQVLKALENGGITEGAGGKMMVATVKVPWGYVI
jgi:hypothetical protein